MLFSFKRVRVGGGNGVCYKDDIISKVHKINCIFYPIHSHVFLGMGSGDPFSSSLSTAQGSIPGLLLNN